MTTETNQQPPRKQMICLTLFPSHFQLPRRPPKLTSSSMNPNTILTHSPITLYTCTHPFPISSSHRLSLTYRHGKFDAHRIVEAGRRRIPLPASDLCFRQVRSLARSPPTTHRTVCFATRCRWRSTWRCSRSHLPQHHRGLILICVSIDSLLC